MIAYFHRQTDVGGERNFRLWVETEAGPLVAIVDSFRWTNLAQTLARIDLELLDEPVECGECEWMAPVRECDGGAAVRTAIRRELDMLAGRVLPRVGTQGPSTAYVTLAESPVSDCPATVAPTA